MHSDLTLEIIQRNSTMKLVPVAVGTRTQMHGKINFTRDESLQKKFNLQTYMYHLGIM
jgi:hypothetical protein